MTKWKIVPVEPNEAQLEAGFEWSGSEDTHPDVYDAMLAAAPRASEDEALVMTIANLLDVTFGNRGSYEEAARAVLKALEG